MDAARHGCDSISSSSRQEGRMRSGLCSDPGTGTSSTQRPLVYISDNQDHRTVAISPHLPTTMQRDAWSLEQFELTKELYRGKASAVFLAVDKLTGADVALKLYRKRKLTVLNRQQVEREIRIHASLDHHNVIKLYAAWEDKKIVYLLLEPAKSGDLFERLRTSGQLTERQAVEGVISPLLKALQHLHSLNIIHRDIKPENILLSSHDTVKLADFGMAIDMTLERPVTRVGTLDYLAPEVLSCPDKVAVDDNKSQQLSYNMQVDVWAVGILSYELLVGYPPFEHESRTETYNNIMFTDPMFPASMSHSARKFIRSALCKDPATRPSVFELCNHAWIRSQGCSAPSSMCCSSEGFAALAASACNLSAGMDLLSSFHEAQQAAAAAPPVLYASTSTARPASTSGVRARLPQLSYVSDPSSPRTPTGAAGGIPNTNIWAPPSFSQAAPMPLMQRLASAAKGMTVAAHAYQSSILEPCQTLVQLQPTNNTAPDRDSEAAVSNTGRPVGSNVLPATTPRSGRPLSSSFVSGRMGQSGPVTVPMYERPKSGFAISLSKSIMPLSWSGIPQCVAAADHQSADSPRGTEESTRVHAAMASLSLHEKLLDLQRQPSTPTAGTKNKEFPLCSEAVHPASTKRARYGPGLQPANSASQVECVLPPDVVPACPASPCAKRLFSSTCGR